MRRRKSQIAVTEMMEQLSKGEAFKNVVSVPGFKKVKDELEDIINALDSIEIINMNLSPEHVKFDLAVNKMCRGILLSWLESIEGGAAAHDMESQAAKVETGIVRY